MHRLHNAVGVAGKRRRVAGCELYPLRKRGGCRWCRTPSQLAPGKLKCHRGVGKGQRRTIARDANAKPHPIRGRRCVLRREKQAQEACVDRRDLKVRKYVGHGSIEVRNIHTDTAHESTNMCRCFRLRAHGVGGFET
eukprot:103510-Pleurochrysis_carterae.AAC.3